ncbi:acetate--CoA ligase family protein [Shouchella sp. 1P09AA]|uniref:acetate--CoA ligase family protein n=1 Tax=unclassified Shouchella TaxID=2893065 RepID=UPI0039A2DCAB
MPNKEMIDTSKSSEFLTEFEGGKILREYGFPLPSSVLAKTPSEAVQAGNEIGYPLVLKGMSREITHKTEAGIVKVGVQNPTQLHEAYKQIERNAKTYDSNVVLDGVLIQSLAQGEIELLIGVKQDPVFGHQLMIGMGGTLVELLKDYSMRMLPVTEEEVDDMVQELKGYELLAGYRQQAGIPFQQLKTICLAINRLVADYPNLEELDLNPVKFTAHKGTICDVRIRFGSNLDVQHVVQSRDGVQQMLNPQSIAVIGASTDEKKNGGRLFRYIVENGYKGELYPVNPKADSIKGYKAYPSLTAIHEQVDLACIIVAASFVPDVMKQCIEKKIKAAIIYSSGFAEVGEKGEQLQEDVLALARQGGIRLLGPNSIGIASPDLHVYTAFGAALESNVKRGGSVAFISQSGAMGSALLSRAWEQGAGFSRWISVANEADLSIADFIEELAEDEQTSVITAFMEGLKNRPAFEEAAKKAADANKPVLIYKTGKSDVGKRAVQSHTGSIAGDDDVYDSFFKKHGILRVQQIDDLIDVSRALAIQPLAKGNRIGIMTASGGACSVIADLCAQKHLEVPILTQSMEEIRSLIPVFGSPQNPVDVTAEVIAKPEMFKQVLKALANDPDIDAVIVMLTTNADPGATVIAQAILDVFELTNKPIVVGRLGADMIAPQAMSLYQKHQFPVYPTPERVVNVMRYVVERGLVEAKRRNSK